MRLPQSDLVKSSVNLPNLVFFSANSPHLVFGDSVSLLSCGGKTKRDSQRTVTLKDTHTAEDSY